MPPNLLSLLIIIVLTLLLVIGIVVIIMKGNGRSNFASLTAYHDFQVKDKQDAVEIVMEEKSGKKMEEQESGKDK